jgi:AcrR family transcriptional regulator
MSAATARLTDQPLGVRERLISATEACLARNGIRRTTVVQIANEAGVSRAWLYRHFPDKASLVVAALVRTDEQFWADAESRVSAVTGIAAQVGAAVTLSLQRRPGALLLRLRSEESDAFAAIVGRGLRELVPGMARFWHPYLEAARASGDVRADLDVERAAEWIIRIVVSLVTIPGEAVNVHDPAGVVAFLEEFLTPGLR